MPPLPRLTGWSLLTAALFVAVAFLAPDNFPVMLYKLNLVLLAAVLGYWFDRRLFFYARPDRVAKEMVGWAMMRRAIIVAAFILGVTLGL